VSGPELTVLVAPDKFKGTMSAEQVAGALAAGVRAAVHRPLVLPVADGGEGTGSVLRGANGGRWVTAQATDALGRPVAERSALLPGGATAVMEVAEATGLWRLDPRERDTVRASSRGTGELIAAAAGAVSHTTELTSHV